LSGSLILTNKDFIVNILVRNVSIVRCLGVVTMKSIAEICGVSRGTVDRALNGRGRVSKETADNIRKVARQLGYQPNPAGKALAARKTCPVIGVVIPAKGNQFFDEVIRGMEEAAGEYEIYGLQIKYYTVKGYDVQEQLGILQRIEPEIQALVICPINDTLIAQQLNHMLNKGILVITVNNDIDGAGQHYYVGSDYHSGGTTACALLEALLGTSARIALVVGSKNVLGHRQRLEGFQQRMCQVADFQLIDVIEHEDDDILAYDVMCRLLREHPEINAISILAAGAYGVCRAVMQLPEEKRPLVIGFDTVPTTVEMMKKGLIKATIYQHPYRQGYTAINKAFEYLVHGRRPDKEAYILKNEIKLLENL